MFFFCFTKVGLRAYPNNLDLPINLPGTRKSRKEVKDESEGIVPGVGRTVGQDSAAAAPAREHASVWRRSPVGRRPQGSGEKGSGLES